jgi:ubiquinone/menaquinone biosynthesis C-methylase UbiE
MNSNTRNSSPFIIRGDAISTDDMVLDLGTYKTDNIDGHQLDDLPSTVIGVDISSSEFPSDIESDLVLGDGRQLPFNADVFDYIYCDAVLEHVNGVGDLIKEAARVTKPTGTVFFGFPNRLSLLQPHTEVPRYYSLLPKRIGNLLSRYIIPEEAEYYKHALFPLTPITARYHLHKNFQKVEYTIRISGETVSDNKLVKRLFRTTNSIVTKAPFKWPYELLWPNASYRCTIPKDSFHR